MKYYLKESKISKSTIHLKETNVAKFACIVFACSLRRYIKSLSGPKVIKLFSCSTQLSMKFYLLINVKMPTMLINVKMPTIVGILTFMSSKNSILGLSESKKAEFLDIFILMRI